MQDKYRFTGKQITHYDNGKYYKLYQIQALRNFRYVDKGAIGGWIEKSSNLSHDGSAWIFNDDKVYGDAFVSHNAEISGDAKISGCVVLSNNSDVVFTN
ncbi:hypothetical protein V4P56_00405 [Bartonella sp. B35(2025)]